MERKASSGEKEKQMAARTEKKDVISMPKTASVQRKNNYATAGIVDREYVRERGIESLEAERKETTDVIDVVEVADFQKNQSNTVTARIGDHKCVKGDAETTEVQDHECVKESSASLVEENGVTGATKKRKFVYVNLERGTLDMTKKKKTLSRCDRIE